MTSDPVKPRRMTESVWFWIYLFSCAGLIGITLLGPKMMSRQVAEERSFQGRQRGLEQAAGQDPTVEMSRQGESLLTLQPQILGLAAAMIFAWVMAWRQRYRTPRAAHSPPSAEPPR